MKKLENGIIEYDFGKRSIRSDRKALTSKARTQEETTQKGGEN